MSAPAPLTAEDIVDHVDAMASIKRVLAAFSPEVRLVILAGSLGNAVCEVGDDRSRIAAIMWLAMANDMATDMLNRTLGENA